MFVASLSVCLPACLSVCLFLSLSLSLPLSYEGQSAGGRGEGVEVGGGGELTAW